MSPKSGKPGSIVAPAEPVQAEEATSADPGEVSRAQSEKITPHKNPESSSAAPGDGGRTGGTGDGGPKKSWIEIKLIDHHDKPVAGARYRVELPGGAVDSGTLDHEGFVRIEGIDPGTCKVTFPDLDGAAWEKV